MDFGVFKMLYNFYKALFCLIICASTLNNYYYAQEYDLTYANRTTNDFILNQRNYHYCNDNDKDNKTNNDQDIIIIGFLGEYSQMRVTLGALPMAVEAVNRDPTLLPGKTLVFKAFDIGEESEKYRVKPISYMTQLRDKYNVAAFVGPGESCSSEALLASAWNIPMLSFKCSDSIVSNKEIFHTFGRTLAPASKVSKSVISLLKSFHWHKFAIIFSKRPIWGPSVAQAIHEQADSVNFTVTHFKEIPDYIPMEKTLNIMQNIIDETFVTTRIYVFIGEHIAMVDFVRCMQNRYLLKNGDYIIISVDDEVYDSKRRINLMERNYLDPYIRKKNSQSLDKESLRSVIKISMSQPQNPNMRELCSRIKDYARKYPFLVPYHQRIFNNISVPIYGLHLYDSVMIYAKTLTNILKIGGNIYDGRLVMSHIFNHSYHSIQGFDVHIDNNGDAEGNYTVITLYSDTTSRNNNMNTMTMSMQPIGYFVYNKLENLPEFRYIKSDYQIEWLKGRPPLAEPLCGFYGELCPGRHLDWRYLIIGSFFGLFLIVAAIFLIKHYRHEQTLASLLWKIDMKDVTIINIHNNLDYNNFKTHKDIYQVCRPSILVGIEANKRAFTNIGLYRGNIVAMKKIYKKSVDITRSIRKELKQMREIRHENIVNFIGISIDYSNIMIFTSYCPRGSLEDVLFNDDLHLDHMFISSLVNDILRGLIYLHDSDIISHGNLRSSNCLVDSRWVCQITDFGLHEFKAGQEQPNKELELKKALWKAPELLRDPNYIPRGTQKGDVYSFGIILYEIIGRKGPWGEINYTPEEIINLVKDYNSEGIFRPSLDQLDTPDYIRQCLSLCWEEDPELRPDIRLVQTKLKALQEGLKPNIFDNMLAIMEKYAYNLESLIQERTYQLCEEKKKTDMLLHQMLPRTVAELLKRGERVEPEYFDCVTILFSDIVSFTELCSTSTPVQVIEMLNDLYTCCDSIISNYDVYKVETIGDAYMVVSGLPVRNGQRHVGEIASLALHLLENVTNLKIRHKPTETLQIRIGMHAGPCAAGVVGLKRPRYCLFGDSVNTASRMESNGEAMRIHISEYTYQLLESLGGFQCHERGLINIKGKGVMRTYWLISQLKDTENVIEITSTALTDKYKKCTTPDLITEASYNEVEEENCVSIPATYKMLMDTNKKCHLNNNDVVQSLENANTTNNQLQQSQQSQQSEQSQQQQQQQQKHWQLKETSYYINRNSYCNCATKCLYNRRSDGYVTAGLTETLQQTNHNNNINNYNNNINNDNNNSDNNNHYNNNNNNNNDRINLMCNENHLCVCRLQNNGPSIISNHQLVKQRGPHSEPIITFRL